MDYFLVATLEVVTGIASLVLIAIGLAIVFGMMKVINLAHGEFLMLGGYATITATKHGLNIWIAVLVVAPVVVGLIGLIVERLVIRRLYGRIIDTMLATWGLSLLFIGLVTTIFGNTTSGITSPLCSISIGTFNTSVYNFFIIGVAASVVLALMLLFKKTMFGVVARATMLNPDMASPSELIQADICGHVRTWRGTHGSCRRRLGTYNRDRSRHWCSLRSKSIHHRDWRWICGRPGNALRLHHLRDGQQDGKLCSHARYW